jgi:hypothetical protein
MAESRIMTKTIIAGQKFGAWQVARTDATGRKIWWGRPADRARGARGRLVPRLWVQRNAPPSSPPPRIGPAGFRR